MKKLWMRWVALLLALVMVLAGCSNQEQETEKQKLKSQSTEEPGPEETPETGEGPWASPKFGDMEYTRPDPEALNEALQKCNALVDGTDSQAMYEALEEYAVLFNSFTTNYHLAHIHYNLDLKDSDWEEEYNFCMEHTAQLSADTDLLLRSIAASDHRDYIEAQEDYGEGYFDDYDGESIWTEEFTQLTAQEEQLQSQYYALVGEDADYRELGELLVSLVQVRQQLAQEAGYEDYLTFAYEYYYGRDYSVEQAQTYLADIREYLVPMTYDLYEDMSWAECLGSTSTKKTFSYVKNMAEEMGGVIAEAFRLLEEKELYHIKSGSNKMDGAFEVYLPDYQVPFVFVNPMKYNLDHLTFTHEFGHFCNDFALDQGTTTIDVAEIFSQGLENLSLFYGDDTLEPYRMAVSLLTYIEQGAYADFELRLYSLERQDVTVENIERIFEEVAEEYYIDVDRTDYSQVNHFYVSPAYVISYVVSNDVALQLYQMEKEEKGSGLECYIDNLDNDTGGFLEFLDSAGLGSPFAPGRIQEVCATFEEVLF